PADAARARDGPLWHRRDALHDHARRRGEDVPAALLEHQVHPGHPKYIERLGCRENGYEAARASVAEVALRLPRRAARAVDALGGVRRGGAAQALEGLPARVLQARRGPRAGRSRAREEAA